MPVFTDMLLEGGIEGGGAGAAPFPATKGSKNGGKFSCPLVQNLENVQLIWFNLVFIT